VVGGGGGGRLCCVGLLCCEALGIELLDSMQSEQPYASLSVLCTRLRKLRINNDRRLRIKNNRRKPKTQNPRLSAEDLVGEEFVVSAIMISGDQQGYYSSLTE
jgi:hypothetical protein